MSNKILRNFLTKYILLTLHLLPSQFTLIKQLNKRFFLLSNSIELVDFAININMNKFASNLVSIILCLFFNLKLMYLTEYTKKNTFLLILRTLFSLIFFISWCYDFVLSLITVFFIYYYFFILLSFFYFNSKLFVT